MWDPVEKLLNLVIEPQIRPFRGPLYFARLQEPALGADVVDQGGFCLVDTGKKKLLVTCNHVWEGFREAQRKDPDLRLHLCLDLERKQPLVFNQHTPIGQDVSLDIVVFDMEPVLAICGGLTFYPLNQNPPPRLKKGNKIVVLGNQGMNRSANAVGLEFGLTIYALEVSDVGLHGPRFHAEMSKVKTRHLRAPTRSPQNRPHGGISGSPCFLVKSPSSLCKLVGFVTEVGLGSLWFIHARCLNPDGTINKH